MGLLLLFSLFFETFLRNLSPSMFWNRARIFISFSEAKSILLLSNSKAPLKPTFLLWLKSTNLILNSSSPNFDSSSNIFDLKVLSWVKAVSDLQPILHPFLFSKAASARALLTDGLKGLLKSIVYLSNRMYLSFGLTAIGLTLLSFFTFGEV
jgi:hypothetical protein